MLEVAFCVFVYFSLVTVSLV